MKFLAKNRLYLIKTVNYYYVGTYVSSCGVGWVFKDVYIVPALEWEDYLQKRAKGHPIGDLWINTNASVDVAPWNTISTLP
jgi:hypothetical protein